MIRIEFVDHSFMRVTGDEECTREIWERFQFYVEGHRFSPKFKAGYWDGKIKLYNRLTGLVYAGLLEHVLAMATHNKWDVEIHEEDWKRNDKLTLDAAETYFASIGLPFEPRPYQKAAFVSAMQNTREVLVMPTGSGKSLVIYLLARGLPGRSLIVVDNLGLIEQMASDIGDYGYKDHVHLIFAGQEKVHGEKITVSTWQSIMQKHPDWFNKFGTVIIDECHKATAAELKRLMEKCTGVKYRYGFTGSMDENNKVGELVLTGLFGPINRVTTSAELIQQEYLSEIQIRCILLKYGQDECKEFWSQIGEFKDEVDYLAAHAKRNKMVCKIASEHAKGNTMLIYRYHAHGDELVKILRETTTRPVHQIDGRVKGKERERIRKILAEETDAIIVGSIQTVSTGINIPTLENVIFASSTKAHNKVIQSIGRVLRRTQSKTNSKLFDIADDLTLVRKKSKKKNFTLKHFILRLQMYGEEQFPFTVSEIRMP